MKRIVLFALCCCCTFAASAQKFTYSVEKIWDSGKYCAFPDIAEYKGKFYCVFREGDGHVFNRSQNRGPGVIRMLVSKNGKSWKPLHVFEKEGVDLRDPMLTITPDGRLMLTYGEQTAEDSPTGYITHTFARFSADGVNFTDAEPMVIKGREGKSDWIWRITWHDGIAYGVDEYNFTLLKSTDGLHYDVIKDLGLTGFPNESTVRFLPDGRMLMVVRRDEDDAMGYFGVSRPPYTEWKWQKMGFRLGGPNMLVLDEDHIVISSRSYMLNTFYKAALFLGNRKGQFQVHWILPSGGHSGDTGYAGMLVKGNQLWVLYYASHVPAHAANIEPNPSIYLAKLPLSEFADIDTTNFYPNEWADME